MSNKYSYRVKHFLRAHSKHNDAADVQTKVWKCEFEPDPSSLDCYTNIVATCGGYSICFINIQTGRVVQKFNCEDVQVEFYDIAWGHCNNKSILAACGFALYIYIIIPSESKVITALPPNTKMRKRKESINCLLFHPRNRDVLFYGRPSGEIVIARIELHNNDPLQIIHNLLHQENCEIIQMTFLDTCKTLLAASGDGLQAWILDSDFKSESKNALLVDIPLASGTQLNCTETVFDTVITLGSKSSVVATKRALEGHILIWDLSDALMHKKKNSKILKVEKGNFLKWSTSDNYFMSIGWNNNKRLLACGDDKGCIWMYNLDSVIKTGLGTFLEPPIEPSFLIPWPKNLRDQCIERTRKLKLDTYDIVIAKVTMSENYIVAVTNNNLVCIWNCPDG